MMGLAHDQEEPWQRVALANRENGASPASRAGGLLKSNDESLPLLFRLFPYAYSAAANNDNDVAAANAAAAAAIAVAVAVSASAAAVLNLTLELLRSESIAASQAERGRELSLQRLRCDPYAEHFYRSLWSINS
ncbi:hypothetical protein T4A_2677 [Trichinella pseudospiralis]|uniref:Uncharacterized protein n=1 Tax=Trichinella pseudospiralis TaxID=6337 RepID=A0A0V1E4U7_TRIPS|nr:hypothetical protein T4A_2677 [Trichinella pseudospiralis]